MTPVSYTHLDVYKRQVLDGVLQEVARRGVQADGLELLLAEQAVGCLLYTSRCV